MNVEEQWSEAMSRQSLYAIFPIAEDVMIGDVLLDTREISAARDSFDVLRLARTDPDLVLKALCEDRNRRIVIAPTAEATDANGTDRTSPGSFDCADPTTQADALTGWRATGEGTPSVGQANRLIGRSSSNAFIRLHRADIPEATVARVSVAQLGAAGFFGNVAANLGLGSANRVGLTIKLTDLESLEIPTRAIIPMLRDGTRRPTAIDPDAVIGVLHQRWPKGAEQLCKGNFSALHNKAEIAIVTRVEYANAINYEFSESSERVLRATLDLSALMPGGTQPTAAPAISAAENATVVVNSPQQSGAAAEGGNGGQVPDADVDAVADQTAARLSSLLSTVTGGPTPGGVTTTLGIGSTGNLQLNANYPRPMAVGAGTRLVYPVEEALVVQVPDQRALDDGRLDRVTADLLLEEAAKDLVGAFDACARVLNIEERSRQVFGERTDYCGSVPAAFSKLARFKEYMCTTAKRRVPYLPPAPATTETAR